MNFEIVNHNHNYSRLLAWQLSSLVNHLPQGHNFTYTLYHAPSDKAVLDVVEYFRPRLPHNIILNLRPQEISMLRNRANGRNEAARETLADWVWFADTDYMFLRHCWTDLYEFLNGHKEMKFVAPLQIFETDWDLGDCMINRMSKVRVLEIDLSQCVSVNKRIAIGGLQIAEGATVRQVGYCPWMVGPSDKWDFRSDMRFRRQKEMNPKADVKLDSVLRIRHSQRGYGHSNWEGVRN